ncbi:hypothetical protein VTK73DRAFT_775 [Phialemonium thermophilum]|uniref:Uncharacterized protein n=1 Tax=Phialemonium thermophilum TaxID=223376 RepID=A0ABR3VUD0_9PEZI
MTEVLSNPRKKRWKPRELASCSYDFATTESGERRCAQPQRKIRQLNGTGNDMTGQFLFFPPETVFICFPAIQQVQPMCRSRCQSDSHNLPIAPGSMCGGVSLDATQCWNTNQHRRASMSVMHSGVSLHRMLMLYENRCFLWLALPISLCTS